MSVNIVKKSWNQRKYPENLILLILLYTTFCAKFPEIKEFLEDWYRWSVKFYQLLFYMYSLTVAVWLPMTGSTIMELFILDIVLPHIHRTSPTMIITYVLVTYRSRMVALDWLNYHGALHTRHSVAAHAPNQPQGANRQQWKPDRDRKRRRRRGTSRQEVLPERRRDVSRYCRNGHSMFHRTNCMDEKRQQIMEVIHVIIDDYVLHQCMMRLTNQSMWNLYRCGLNCDSLLLLLV